VENNRKRAGTNRLEPLDKFGTIKSERKKPRSYRGKEGGGGEKNKGGCHLKLSTAKIIQRQKAKGSQKKKGPGRGEAATAKTGKPSQDGPSTIFF